MAFDLGGLLQQYLGPTAGTEDAADHYHQVAQGTPSDVLSQGLAAAFHSDQTPPFGDMVAQLFAQGSPQQQAGMLTQLLSSLGPAALAALSRSGALSGLQASAGGALPTQVTPDQVSQLTPEQVGTIAEQAQQHSPGIVDQMSGFFAEHPTLVKTLGGAVLSIALAKIAERMRS